MSCSRRACTACWRSTSGLGGGGEEGCGEPHRPRPMGRLMNGANKLAKLAPGALVAGCGGVAALAGNAGVGVEAAAARSATAGCAGSGRGRGLWPELFTMRVFERAAVWAGTESGGGGGATRVGLTSCGRSFKRTCSAPTRRPTLAGQSCRSGWDATQARIAAWATTDNAQAALRMGRRRGRRWGRAIILPPYVRTAWPDRRKTGPLTRRQRGCLAVNAATASVWCLAGRSCPLRVSQTRRCCCPW